MMLKGNSIHERTESPIFDQIPLYKVITTNRDRTIMLHMDGSVSMIVPFEGINNTSMSEYDFEGMFRRMQSTFDDLDATDISAQFLMVRDSSISAPDKESLPSFLKPRADYLEYLADNYQLFVNHFYIAIHCRSTNESKSEGTIAKIYNKWKHRNDNSYKYNRAMNSVENRVTKVIETVEGMCQMLTDMGATFRIIKKEQEYYDIIQKFTRPSKSKEEYIHIDNDSDDAPRQQLFSGVRASVSKYDFVLDDYYHKVWTLDRSPRQMIYGKTIEAIETVPFEFIYSVTFRKANQEESLNTFKFKLMEKQMASGGNKGALVEDRTLIAEEQRVSDSYDQFANNDAYGCVVSANFVLRCKEEFIEKMCRSTRVSREEMLRRFDQQLTKRVFSSFGYSEWIAEEGTGFPVFCSIIPGMSNMFAGVMKNIFLITSNIPYFLACYDNKRILAHNGTNHFIDMRGNRVVFDLMDPTLPAWNYSISGQTGSGKSVLVNAILTMQFAEANGGKRPVICILDVGGDRGSYTKFMELVKGTQINLSRTMKPNIQMFELISNRSLPQTSKIKKVASIIYKDLLSDNPELANTLTPLNMETKIREYYNERLNLSPEESASDFKLKELFVEMIGFPQKPSYKDLLELKAGEVQPDQKQFNLIMGVLEVVLSTSSKKLDGFDIYDYDEISDIVMETYRRIGERENRYPYMTDFLAIATEMVDASEPDAKRLLTKLKNYTREGAYPMFDQDTNVDTSNDVILTDLKGLESEPQLQVIYTLLISQLYNNKMYYTRDRRKLIVRDEAWSLMQNERARKYFVEDLRTARKNGFATIAISQLPTDYLFPSAQDGKAIMSNMQVNIFCKFVSDSICQEVGREYSLGPEIVEEMKHLGVQKEIQEDGSFKPTYGKFMMVMGRSVYIMKNLLHPFEYALYSSSAEDNAIIDYYMKVTKEYRNLEDVLWVIAQGKHIGNEGLADFLSDSGYSNMATRIRRKGK